MKKGYMCIDIGGTAIKYGVLESQEQILFKESMKTEAWKGGRTILEKVLRIVEECKEKFELQGAAISTAGMVDCEKGEVLYSGELIPDYTGTNFKRTIEEKFGIPCEVENDVNCAGLAEWNSGAARESKIALCLTIGTGIGGCILLDGEIFHGFSNSACEIGYLHMGESDFQTLGAASIMSEKIARIKGEKVQMWDGVRIFKEAKAGDSDCAQAIAEMCDVLGRGIADLCYAFNPEIVVLGGGVMEQKEVLRPKIEEALSKYLKPVIFAHTRIGFAVHGNEAGMLGAFYHFMKRQNKSVNPSGAPKT